MELPIGEGFILRSWRLTDEGSLLKYANNRKVWINLPDFFPHPYTIDDARAFLASRVGPEARMVLAIATPAEAIGAIGLRPRADVNRRSAELGYWLGEPFWGRGIATQAVKALCAYGFSTLDLVRI